MLPPTFPSWDSHDSDLYIKATRRDQNKRPSGLSVAVLPRLTTASKQVWAPGGSGISLSSVLIPEFSGDKYGTNFSGKKGVS